MKILTRNLIAEVGRGDIFKLTIQNQSSHETNNVNEFRAVNLATSKNLAIQWNEQ
jgi:hypothetical protein